MFRTILLMTLLSGLTLAHVRVRSPPNRSSVWRDPAFSHLNPPKNYDDDGNYCGQVHQFEDSKNCGICGDHINDARPRANEDGGTYGRGIIVAKYQPGQAIPIKVEFTTTHQGFFEMQFCDHVPETEDCFQTLKFGDGKTRWPIKVEDHHLWVNTTLQLPSHVKCEQCVLRLHYRAGNNWGDCGDGTEGMGCGLQETFRNCIDVSIL